jgi:branched-subunit amino acid aminotransferase/4-amino-4-deoxychorismate lyase
MLEGTRTNFSCIKGKTIYSPSEEKILLGVTRKHVLDVAAKNNFAIKMQDIQYADISAYDGVFLTSTSSKIMPIRSIDTTILAPIPSALRELMWLFDEFLAQQKGALE